MTLPMSIQRGMSPLPHFAMMGNPSSLINGTQAVPAGTTVDYFWPKISTAFFVSDPNAINQGVANKLLATGQFKNITVVYNTTEPGYVLSDWGQMHVIATTAVPFASMVAVANAIESGMGGDFVIPASDANFVDSAFVQLAPGPAAPSGGDTTNRGIETILQNPDPNADPDFDVIFSDGTSGVFDIEGNYLFGTRGNIASIDFSTNEAGVVDGISANMQDGAEVYFDFAGNWVYTYDPKAGAISGGAGNMLQRAITGLLNPGTTPGAKTPASTIALTPATGGTYTAAQIQAMIQAGVGNAGATASSWFDPAKILSTLGLSAIPAALGFSAGTVVGGIVIGVYLIFNGFGGKRR